jgi:hypothetical protein
LCSLRDDHNYINPHSYLRMLKNSYQPPLSPSLGGIEKLGGTPTPSAGRFLHLFFSSLYL